MTPSKKNDQNQDEFEKRKLALDLATRVRQPDDTANGVLQLARARRYLAFLRKGLS